MALKQDLESALEGVGVDARLTHLFSSADERLKKILLAVEEVKGSLENRITYTDELERGARKAQRFLEDLGKCIAKILEGKDDGIRERLENFLEDLVGVQEELNFDPDPNEECELVIEPRLVNRHTAAKFASSMGMHGPLETPQKRSVGSVAIVVRKRGDATPPVEC